jgi:hypothetical protein
LLSSCSTWCSSSKPGRASAASSMRVSGDAAQCIRTRFHCCSVAQVPALCMLLYAVPLVDVQHGVLCLPVSQGFLNSTNPLLLTRLCCWPRCRATCDWLCGALSSSDIDVGVVSAEDVADLLLETHAI